MNSTVAGASAWQVFGALTVQVVCIVGIAALAQQATQSALWRRTIWQVCTLSLAVLVLCEVTGLAGAIGRRVGVAMELKQRQSVQPLQGKHAAPRIAALPLDEEFRQKVAEQLSSNERSGSPGPAGMEIERSEAPPPAPPEPIVSVTAYKKSEATAPEPNSAEHFSSAGLTAFWLTLAWCIGAGAFVARLFAARFLFALFRWRCRPIGDSALQQRVEILAGRLKIGRRVRLIESPRLAGPVVFGIVRPTIGLPGGFAQHFDSVQQDVILSHELSHVAAHDPAWHLLADLVSATLWWHPLAWWSRRQLHVATESAADEASLLIANGPEVLAECLVELGGRLVQPRSLAWMGMEGNGFRSGLGRRVERLMTLKGRSWSSPSRVRVIFTKITGPVLLASAAVLGAAWAGPQTLNKGDAMNTLPQIWKQLAAAFALATGVATENNLALAADASKPPSNSGAALEAADSRLAIDPRLAERHGLKQPENASVLRAATATLARRVHRWGVPGDGSVLRATQTPLPAAKQRVQARLEQTILNEVVYDGIPLSEVLKDLSTQALSRDPEKRGINLLISNAGAKPVNSAAINPTTGAAIPAPNRVDLNNVIIRFNLPLRDVRLKDVLDVITKVADHPIHYSVENYGVVFAPGSPPAQAAPDEISEPKPRYQMDPKLLARYGLLRPGMTMTNLPTSPQAQAPQPPSKLGKLEAIALKEVHYDGLPLNEVLKDLCEQSRRLDPEKQGINFIINPNRPPVSNSAVDPTTGQPLAPGPAEMVDPRSILVRFNLPLRNVRLKDVLDAITKVADQPIQYSVENYGVIFSLASSEPVSASPDPIRYYGMQLSPARAETLEVRTFRVDTNTFLKGLESAFGISVTESGNEGGKLSKIDEIRIRQAEEELSFAKQQFEVGRLPQESFNKAKYALELLRAEIEEKNAGRGKLNSSRTLQQALRQLFSQLGVNMDEPNKTMFYNDLTGILMVRATVDDLKVIQAAIETLGGIEANSRKAGTVSVIGAVAKVGAVELPAGEKMDVIEAIAKAGGFAPGGNKSKIELTRKGKTTVYKFDVLRKETDLSKKVWLESGDVIHVGEVIF